MSEIEEERSSVIRWRFSMSSSVWGPEEWEGSRISTSACVMSLRGWPKWGESATGDYGSEMTGEAGLVELFLLYNLSL